MDKYLTLDKPDKDHINTNDWFNYCRENEKPYIVATLKGKFCDIHWDYITYDATYEKQWENLEIDEFSKTIFYQFANKSSELSPGNKVVTMKNMDARNLDSIASILYDFIHKKVQSEICV